MSCASSTGARGTAPARSGLVRSMPLSITATETGASCGSRQGVRIEEGVDGGQVPLASRQRVGRRPGQRAPAHAELRRERAEEAPRAAPAHSPAATLGPHAEPERAVRPRLCARNPRPASVEHVLQRDEAARAGREQPPPQQRTRAAAQQQAGMADHGHGRRRQRARNEPVARRLADRAPERDGLVVADRVRGDVAPAELRRRLQRGGAGRCGAREQHAVAHHARVQGDRRPGLGRGRPRRGREPGRAQPEALAQRARPRARAGPRCR